MNFQKSSSRFPGANDILDHTLIPAIVGLAGILDGQIAAIDNANTLVANQIERLSVFAPRDLRIRGSSGGTAFHQGHFALGHTGIRRLQAEFVAQN